MKTVGVSRLAIVIAVAGTIFASSASGCVVHERTVRWSPHPYPVVRVAPYPYPVIVHRHPPRAWHAGPKKPWVHGCHNCYRSHDRHRRFEADRRDRRHDRHGRFRGFDG
jgi:hypothetical protein